MASSKEGRPATREGVRGHVVTVAPREGYERFVPAHYDVRKPSKKR